MANNESHWTDSSDWKSGEDGRGHQPHSDDGHGHAHGSEGSCPISGPALIIEPVINFVAGSGLSDTSFGLYDPDFVNPATGEHPFLALMPGQVDTYAAGFPPDAELLEFSVTNNTNYDITSLTMKIIGGANDLIPGASWTIDRGAKVNAFFGDANGDGKVGLSDIFSKIKVSDDGRSITLSGGVIPAGSRFTDQIASYTTGGEPASAGVDGSFGGILAHTG
jgi:hypothetical protein